MERPSFKAKAVFEAILEAILTLRPPPPGASKIDNKCFKMGSKIEAFFETPVGLDFGARGAISDFS